MPQTPAEIADAAWLLECVASVRKAGRELAAASVAVDEAESRKVEARRALVSARALLDMAIDGIRA